MKNRSRKLFLTDYYLTPFENIPSGGILLENDRIIATGGATAFSKNEPGLEIYEMEDTYAVPGFIDTHIHGIDSFDLPDLLDGKPVLPEMSRILARHGVTTFCPTIVSQPPEIMPKLVSAIADALDQEYPDADPYGIHLEGPFLNPEKRGSQSEAALSKVDLGYAKELIAAGNNRIKLMVVAPELEGADKLRELLMENGIIVSMGHSMADEEQTLRAIANGAQHCSHIFNGMPLLHHRQSSLTTVALTDDRVSLEIIVDGAHIHPRMVNMVSRLKPKDKLIGVSNSVASIQGTHIDENSELVTTSDGIIKGSTITLENSWFHLLNYAKMPKTIAAACFTHNPAKEIGLVSRGEIKPGKRADITFFDSNTNKVRMTVSRGNIIYRAEAQDD